MSAVNHVVDRRQV